MRPANAEHVQTNQLVKPSIGRVTIETILGFFLSKRFAESVAMVSVALVTEELTDNQLDLVKENSELNEMKIKDRESFHPLLFSPFRFYHSCEVDPSWEISVGLSCVILVLSFWLHLCWEICSM